MFTRLLAAALFAVTFAVAGFGQGSTTAGITGFVTDTNGEPLIGATIQA